MSDKILQDIFTECNMTLDSLKHIVPDKKESIYELLKHKITQHKKQKESAIRNQYEELKKHDLNKTYIEFQQAEAIILSSLNHNVVKRKKYIMPDIKEDIWQYKYGDRLTNNQCHVCNKININKSNYAISHIIPESKAGTNEITNLVPTCINCEENVTLDKTNLIEYREKVNPIDNYENIFENLVKKYWLFHYNEEDGIVIPNTWTDMMPQMVLCDSEFNKLNNNYKNHLDINIMKCANIIDYEGNIDMTMETGNDNEKCYMVNIVPLYHYLHIMEPLAEKIPVFNTDLYDSKPIFNFKSEFASKPSITFGSYDISNKIEI